MITNDFFAAVKTKYLTLDWMDEDHFLLGESFAFSQKQDTYFPRLEVLPDKLKFDGNPTTERMLDGSIRFITIGYILEDTEITVEENWFEVMDKSKEVFSLLGSFNTDKINGTPPCDGFIQMDVFPEIWWYEEKMTKRLFSFIIGSDANVSVTDLLNT